LALVNKRFVIEPARGQLLQAADMRTLTQQLQVWAGRAHRVCSRRLCMKSPCRAPSTG
jgi:hypothetical protein